MVASWNLRNLLSSRVRGNSLLRLVSDEEIEVGDDTACDAVIRIFCCIQHAAAPPRPATCGMRG